jgi:hypothetical protein
MAEVLQFREKEYRTMAAPETLACKFVLMVADGLHADSVYEADEFIKGNASHLRYTASDHLECYCVKVNEHNLDFW